mgnify:CR=1 FL=1
MNPELQKFVETKLDEIKEKVKEYMKNTYGDFNIDKISVEESWESDNNDVVQRKIEITAWTNKGYFNIES